MSARPWILLPLALLVAIPARWLAEPSAPAPAPPSAAQPALLRKTLRLQLQALGERQRVLQDRMTLGRPAARSLLPTEPAPEELALAVQSWLETHELSPSVLEEPTEVLAESQGLFASLPLEELLQAAMELAAFVPDSERLYQELRDAGRMDELLAGLEARVAADPNNPDLRITLGIAYLEKLFGLTSVNLEAGQLAMLADENFDRALELDPDNVRGRFSKAVALSNWPPFMGKTGAAIEEFKLLVEQTERGQIADPKSEPYLFLGNLYLRNGEREKALQSWRDGLRRFPGDVALLGQVAAEVDADG